jgi:predicted transposase YdaD
MSNKPFDQAFKYLAEQDAESLLILLGHLRPGQEAEIEALPRELNVSTQLPDQPYRVVVKGEPRIVHVEAQTVYETSIPERMAEYGARLWMKYRLAVDSYVLLLTERGLPKAETEQLGRGEIVAGGVRIESRYKLIKLWESSAKEVMALGRANLLPFIPLMRGGKQELAEAARQLAEMEDARQGQDLRLHFIVLGGLRYNVEEILEAVGRGGMIPWEQLKESSVYQHILKEGKKEGLEEGIEKGKLEAIREMLNLLIEKRFPGLDLAPEIGRIADLAALERLCLEVIELPDAEAIKKRVSETADQLGLINDKREHESS